MSDYTLQFTKLRSMLNDTGNSNLVRDFYVQLLSIRNLNKDMILNNVQVIITHLTLKIGK